ncbi:hypothetical protein M405DRAFT_312818 [Rhizopogon salebrosus TDB-379]|nr:hypothetical protein M405DRAFT_312818 [Rhizopogon salebrosus TDB-379]
MSTHLASRTSFDLKRPCIDLELRISSYAVLIHITILRFVLTALQISLVPPLRLHFNSLHSCNVCFRTLLFFHRLFERMNIALYSIVIGIASLEITKITLRSLARASKPVLQECQVPTA